MLFRSQQLGQDDQVVETFRRYEKALPPSSVPLLPILRDSFCRTLRTSAAHLAQKGQNQKAGEALEVVLHLAPDYSFDGLTHDQARKAIEALKSGAGAATPLLKP